MKIFILKTTRDFGFSSGCYKGSVKLITLSDDEITEETDEFVHSHSALIIPYGLWTKYVADITFTQFRYTIVVNFGLVGSKVTAISKDGQPIPLDEVVITYGQDTIVILDDQS
ncbi:hypothetical protein BGX20_005566 [Mortierella sp. AD010]|nr:hypothetical protein BGX20_005566 [Mortierella sp. AD010]